MRKLLGVLLALVVLAGWGAPTYAAPLWWDWKYNIDGVTVDNFLGGTAGFNTISIVGVTGAGPHFAGVFFDADTGDLAFVDGDSGQAIGSPPAGLSWEIGSPWDYAIDPSIPGAIAGDFAASTATATGLKNQVNADILGGFPLGGDVAMAMGWNFILADGETADITFLFSSVAPAGFYLKQFNLGTSITDQIFMAATLDIQGGGGPTVPEPGTLLLMGSGLLGFVGTMYRMHRKG